MIVSSPFFSLIAMEDAATPPAEWLGAQIRRLERLLDLQREHSANLNHSGRRLLNHAIFVTYVECRESGGRDMALAILDGERLEVQTPA